MASRSSKTEIIESLFLDPRRWSGQKFDKTLVTLEQVQEAIITYNKTAKKPLSTNNPANFFKDFVRKLGSAEKNWPSAVLRAGYTAVQRTGDGDCFEFIPLQLNQNTAFPINGVAYPKDPAKAILSIMQTLSLEVMTKALARKDENWLQSVAVALNIPQSHIALHPDALPPLIQLGHVQSNLKLRRTEIDGLYYAHVEGGRVALITMEAKGDSDDILASQVEDQVEAIQNLPAVKTLLSFMKTTEEETFIIPMAMKIVPASCASNVPEASKFRIVGKKLLYMVHYKPVPFRNSRPEPLSVLGETLFDMRPPIAGINK